MDEKALRPNNHEKMGQKIQLISFEEECDDIEDLSPSKFLNQPKQSIIQHEKENFSVKRKITEYLKQRKSLGFCNNVRSSGSFDFQAEENQNALMDQLGSIMHVEQSSAQIEEFIILFNKKPENAINTYIKKGIIWNDTPEAIARYLFKMDKGLDKGLLGEYFGKSQQRILKILREYCRLIGFDEMEFDEAIRKLLGKFRLPGEAQQIQRIIWEFSQAFFEANEDYYDNADELFPLAYAIIMLATDAHNPKQERKMSKEDFVKNTQRPCPSIPAQYLHGIYERITREKFETQTSQLQNLYARLRFISLRGAKQTQQTKKYLKKGDVFLKSCKDTTKFVQRKIYLSQDEEKIFWVSDPLENQKEEPRFLNIKDIIDLTLGIGSPVMQRNKVPLHFDSLCFTISTTHRTLDLKARTSKERARWVNYIRGILIDRREKRKLQLEKEYQLFFSKDKIEEIWNNEIFQHWDKHWDYKTRKPRQKNYIVRGFEAICGCFSQKNIKMPDQMNESFKMQMNPLKNLWKHGLPEKSRKTLWPLVIGNNLAITPAMIELLKKRKKKSEQLRQKSFFQLETIQMVEIAMQMRNDLPPVRDLLLISTIFYQAIPKTSISSPLPHFLNTLHRHHFLAFYRGDKAEIDLRIKLFERQLSKNTPLVWNHFRSLKLQTRLYLVGWFLSAFGGTFQDDQIVCRVWDNFLLEGQFYLFRVGLTLVKYFQIELKMCTFHEGLELLRSPRSVSSVLFFHLLEKQVSITEEDYYEYVERRKHAIIKTKVQAIPLE